MRQTKYGTYHTPRVGVPNGKPMGGRFNDVILDLHPSEIPTGRLNGNLINCHLLLWSAHQQLLTALGVLPSFCKTAVEVRLENLALRQTDWSILERRLEAALSFDTNAGIRVRCSTSITFSDRIASAKNVTEPINFVLGDHNCCNTR